LNSTRQTDRQIKEVNGLKLLPRQLTLDDSVHRRKKRGVFNLVGEISKIFGTMDDQDALYYADKLSLLEREQLDFLKLSKERISVVRTTL
jgi:hypothetical protein